MAEIKIKKNRVLEDRLEEEELYSIERKGDRSIIYPLIKGRDIINKLMELGYYHGKALIDIIIRGPFKHLYLGDFKPQTKQE